MSINTDFYPPKTSEPEQRDYVFRLLGTGAAAPTIEEGPPGVIITRTATGVYRLTWAGNPGTFLNWSPGLGAATPSDVKNFSLVRDTYDATNRRLDFSLFNAAAAAADLAANCYADLVVRFKETDV